MVTAQDKFENPTTKVHELWQTDFTYFKIIDWGWYISGPMLDRIDIHVEVPRVDYEKLSDDRLGEPSTNVQARVETARERQRLRFGETELACNADMRPAEVRDYCQLDETSNSLMRTAMNQMQLSARAYHRVLKLARTIADLAGEENIAPNYLAEALQYRPKLGMV
jgi:magnesium chelatase family protein